MVVRKIKVDIPPFDALGLPPILKNIAMLKRGLVLVVGGTGAGKSTTLASMIDVRNSNDEGHIITIEDPLEFVHQHKKSIITQREVGFDTNSFQDALVNTLRQAPDVILIGEIRDSETMEAAITFADTGHLCFGTLHSTNANQSFERILNFFPPVRYSQVRLQLSLNLRAIISQRLIRTVGGGRVAALEILLDTPRIRDLIKKGAMEELKDAMEQGIHEGCQTFDQALFVLYQAGQINLEEALASADSANNLRLKIKMSGLSLDDASDGIQEDVKSDNVEESSPTLQEKSSLFRLQDT
jgi:twitching motility protein PilU